MLESFIGFSIFIAAFVFIYFKVVKPQMDKKKEVYPVAPPISLLKEESGVNGGQANGDRTHFRFRLPGKDYGLNVQVQFDDLLPIWVVPDGAVRTTPGTRVWKPESENDHKLVVIGDAGKKYKKCIIKYKG